MALSYIQKSFIGGMNQIYDATRIGEDQYWLLINGRSRKDTIRPIRNPEIQADGLPMHGLYQGVYSAGKFAIVFVNGNAYYRDYTIPDSIFGKISGFQMSSTVNYIYTQPVPASTINFKKSLATTDKAGAVRFTSSISKSPQCLVVQDGINQPCVIFPNGSWRVTQTYSQWTNSDDDSGNREYVPIGKEMKWVGGILVVVDGPFIYRSVTGRPLDFMVNIDSNGDKLPNENEGGVKSVSYAVDFDNITCISTIVGGPIGSFLASTVNATYLVIPDYTNLIFGEPTFNIITASSSGCVNQFSVLDVLGDTSYISGRGIGSFNATQLTQTESNNNPFSASIYPIFENKSKDSTINQDTVCCVRFNDYGFYAVNTKYGYGVVVYDMILQKFVAIDIFDINIVTLPIKQFAAIKIGSTNKLLFITDEALYEAFGAESVAVCKLYPREWCSNDPSIEQKSMLLSLVFTDSESSGVIDVQMFSDKVLDIKQTETIIKSQSAESVNVSIPFDSPASDAVQNISLDFGRGRQGWKAGFMITWDIMCELSHLRLESADIETINSFERKAKAYTEIVNGN